MSPTCAVDVYKRVVQHSCPCGAKAGEACTLTKNEASWVYAPWFFVHTPRYEAFTAPRPTSTGDDSK